MKTLLRITLFVVSFNIFAQQQTTRDQINEGIQYFNDQNLIKATAHFKALLKSTPGNSEIIYWAGRCYEVMDDKKKAADMYLAAFKKSKYAAPDILFRVGRAYQLKENYKEAIKFYKQYKNALNQAKVDQMKSTMRYETFRTDKMIKECESGMKLTAKPYNHKLTNLGRNINSPFQDYTPLITADNKTLFFTSRRKGGITDDKDLDDSYFEDIWMSKRDAKGNWMVAQNLGKPVNSHDHDASIALSPDGKQLFIYKSSNGGDIYVSERKNSDEEWSHPKSVGRTINSSAQEASMSITADGKIIYFSSNREGGLGGLDLYYVEKDANGDWSEPKNIGSQINTEFEEDAPFISSDGKTLYFSSSGHDNMGGYDIFKTTYDPLLRIWSKPINLGVPVNSSEDDIYIVFTKDQKIAYFSSGRFGGQGEKDIIMINIDATFAKIKPNFSSNTVTGTNTAAGLSIYTGKIVNEKTGEPLDCYIRIKNFTTNEATKEYQSNKDGSFSIPLKKGNEYAITIEKPNFLFYSINLNLKKSMSASDLNPTFQLKKPEEGQKIVLKNINFDKGKSTLTVKSYHEIESLYNFLKNNPTIKIEVSGHTDNQGTPAANKKLSAERAKTIYNYLIKKGIPASNLKYAGYGSEKPVASNATEDGRRKNRRTEFEIIDL
ncbi:MAG: OmpA family protein [Bacteroidota bacterium]|nr:OmpA family protein [Bacteroidota bacterium]